jgi:hypothetical protein
MIGHKKYMNFIEPTEFVNIDDYEYIISIGNKCPTAMILQSLELYKQSFLFDYLSTTPELILHHCAFEMRNKRHFSHS